MPIKKSRPEPTGVRGIYKDGPKRFLVRVRWTDPRTGRRRKKERVASTLAKAVALKAELAGTDPTPRSTRQRFADYVEQWLREHPEIEGSSLVYYVNNLGHATATFGQYYLDAIQPGDIRKWMASMKKRGYRPRPTKKNPEPKKKSYSNATINGWLRVLRHVLDDAVDAGVFARNPARGVKALKEGRTRGLRGTALSLKEFRRFIESVEKLTADKEMSADVGRMLITAAWTGMRKGELFALRWDDVVEGEIRVERSVYKRKEKATKTGDPRRVTIVEPLEQVLNAQRRWLLVTQHPGLESGLVFPASPRHARAGASRCKVDEVSWYRSPSVLDAPLKKVVDAAEVPAVSAHSFRRTFENLQREAGVDLLVRRAVAGWRTESAHAIYATVARSERDAAAKAVVELVTAGAAGC